MARINIKTGKIIERQEFTGSNPEQQLQSYIEKHLNQFFHCYFLKNFFKIPGGEIDTLAITEDGMPCIIEYKHKKEETILNQIVFYYDWLKERSTKFEFERIVKENEITKNLVVDWSKIRLICIAKEYSKWDISLIRHLDSDIECCTYAYHKDELDVHLDPIISQFKKQKFYNNKLSSVKEITLEDHRNKATPEGKLLLDKLREGIFKLGDDITEGYTPEYIRYVVNTIFSEIHVKKKWLIVYLRVNEATFNDPKGLARDISHLKFSVTRKVKITNIDELNYTLTLIKQAYGHQ